MAIGIKDFSLSCAGTLFARVRLVGLSPGSSPVEPWKSLPIFYSSVKKTVVKKLVPVLLGKKEG